MSIRTAFLSKLTNYVGFINNVSIDNEAIDDQNVKVHQQIGVNLKRPAMCNKLYVNETDYLGVAHFRIPWKAIQILFITHSS